MLVKLVIIRSLIVKYRQARSLSYLSKLVSGCNLDFFMNPPKRIRK